MSNNYPVPNPPAALACNLNCVRSNNLAKTHYARRVLFSENFIPQLLNYWSKYLESHIIMPMDNTVLKIESFLYVYYVIFNLFEKQKSNLKFDISQVIIQLWCLMGRIFIWLRDYLNTQASYGLKCRVLIINDIMQSLLRSPFLKIGNAECCALL